MSVINESVFFREATLRICGSLEIEKAMCDCLMYIREYIPVDIILFSIYDPGLGIAELIAKADVNGGEKVSIKTVVSPETRRMIEDLKENQKKHPLQKPRVVIADPVSNHPIMGNFAENIGHPDGAFMAIGPKPEWDLYGGVIVVNNRGEKFSEKHVKLFTLLNEPFAIALSNHLRYREVLRLKEILTDDNRYLYEELRQQSGVEIVGAHFGLKQVMEMVGQVAPLSSPVLLLGETGTGKEVVATAIHNLSSRRSGPFIKVNCGAIPETLMDSELFGHERGAFTGALFQKRGRFERANGGTIFLDEIGELTPGAQIRLLRVIQEKEIERVGGTDTISVDIRVIAATHRNLEDQLMEGKFREDLYFRLKVFPIVIPPLRERRIDIPVLVQYFLMKKSSEMNLPDIPSLAPGAIDRLRNYHWPGNVRELQNTVERALILCRNGLLSFHELAEISQKPNVDKPFTDNAGNYSLESAVTREIVKALEATGGYVGGARGAAKLLNMNPSTLWSKMRKLGIPSGRKRLA